ncbi:LysE family translocator [Roseibium sp. RKSG952]|uniref:LysE family translocator n=1 Tax=Roseibium sp. RKSG952 TaxID=2529384 RepID=UPI0012BD5402|nr:LysE family translocator [Roseibium sp. RKSG952]MTH96048.1 LysE family translocator [Roseibium sp. RKSG952]
MPIETWLLFVAMALVPALTPGPAVLLAISNSLRFGSRATLVSGTGNAIGVAILGFLVSFGLSALLKTSATAFEAVKWAGAAYLVFLGIKTWADKSHLRAPDLGSNLITSNGRLFRQAFIVALTNPKMMFFISALFPQFMPHHGVRLETVGIMSSTLAAMCWANHAFIASAGTHLRQLILQPKSQTILRRTAGALFIGFGAVLAVAAR